MTQAMLECTRCESRKYQQLDEPQVKALHSGGACAIFCPQCGGETMWGYVSHDRRSGDDRRLYPRPIEPPAKAAPVVPPAIPAAGNAPPKLDAYQELARAAFLEKRGLADRRDARMRGPRRVPLELPVRVRVPDPRTGFAEVTNTSNVCRGGIYIHSDKVYSVGMEVMVAMNYSETILGSQPEHRARVVRIDLIPGNHRRGVAIHFER